MHIRRRGATAPITPSPDYFTGRVSMEPLAEVPAPARVRVVSTTFQPGARTNWHTHPLGQVLVVTAGRGWTQCWGEAKVEIGVGDVVTCAPGRKHWHGATDGSAMTHLAIQEALDGKVIDWLEPVSEEQYLAAAGAHD